MCREEYDELPNQTLLLPNADQFRSLYMIKLLADLPEET